MGVSLKKKIFASFMICSLLCIECFSAIVSDNDGSAFVTKSEFENLKQDFVDQIVKYNESIDGKIDGAIASYLAGIRLNKKVFGINYFDNLSDVRFYTITKDLNTSNIDSDVYMYWLVRGFGSLGGYMSTSHNVTNLYTYGSWLYNSDGTHARDGRFNTRGNSTNYFYKVNNISIGTTEYKSLSVNKSLSVRASLGGFASGYKSDNKWGDNTVAFGPYDLDLSSWSTNELGAWRYTWSQNGMSMNADGIKFNVWNNSENTSDLINNYYYFNNNTLKQDTSINTFTESDFIKFGDTEYTFDPGVRTGGDAWYISHSGRSNAISEWTGRRAYVGAAYGSPPNYITYDWFSPSTLSYNRNSGKIKYKRPNFKSIQSGALVNGEATSALGKPVYPYNGVPVTTLDNGTLGLEAKVTVTAKKNSDDTVQSGKPYYILISNKPFENIATSTLVSNGDTDNIRIFYQTSGASIYNIEIKDDVLENWKKDDDIYMRVMIEDANCYAKVTVSDIILTIE